MTVAMIIAAYNAETTIERAVASALAEAEITQVIVVDDASNDDTATRAVEQDDGSGRLIVLHQKTNEGPSAARNRALAAAAAEWIGILDADDFLLPGRTAGMLRYAGGADLIADNLWQMPEGELDGPRRLLLDEAILTPRSIGFDEFVLSNITSRRHRGELGFVKPIMRHSFLTYHGLAYQEHMRLGEDFELYARALAMGARFLLVPLQGYVSILRANSLSGQHSEIDLLNLRESDRALEDDLSLSPSGIAALRKHYLSVDCRLQWRLLIAAVKRRDLWAALASFCRPYPVPFYLIGKLLEQAYLRTAGKGAAS